jgi:hypothetical protein
VELPPPSINPNAGAKPVALHVERTLITIDGALVYDMTPRRPRAAVAWYR